jgi:hypothetical protein
MGTETQEKRIPSDVRILTANKKFGRYKKEDPKQIREASVRENEAVKRMLEVFDSWLESYNKTSWQEGYENILNEVRKIDYSMMEIQTFIVVLTVERADRILKDNFSLSALINNCKEKECVLNFETLNAVGCEPWSICYENQKLIRIKGNVAERIGERMKSGIIILDGNINQGIGIRMTGGEIIVNGNVSHVIGHKMQGGEIHINGDILYHKVGDIAKDVIHGQIYHKGNLIVDK